MSPRRSTPRRSAAAPHEPRLARVAALVADATRSRMLCFLLSGEYASAGELARAGSVTPATASAHLAKLCGAGLVVCEPRGRHRYFRLADAEVAHALGALALVAERGTHERAWSASPARLRLRYARCCYGHLAGRLGVALLGHLLAQGWLEPALQGYRLTPNGAAGLNELGLDGIGWLQQTQAPDAAARLAYPCLDWSERRDHLAGKLAAALLERFVEAGWLRRRPDERALDLTPKGRAALGGWVAPVVDAPLDLPCDGRAALALAGTATATNTATETRDGAGTKPPFNERAGGHGRRAVACITLSASAERP